MDAARANRDRNTSAFLKRWDRTRLSCRSRVIKPGRTLLVTESEVYAVRDDTEALVAKAMLTMAAVPQDKVPTP